MNPVDRQITQLEGKLAVLLAEIRGTDLHARAEAYIGKFSNGRPLAEWVRDRDVPVKQRAAGVEALIEILLRQEYDRLPVLTERVVKGIAPDGVPIIEEEPASESPSPLTEERVRLIIRQELASVLETIAKVLKEPA